MVINFKRGDKVKITGGPQDKKGKAGVITFIMKNGAMVKLSKKHFTPVKFKHLKLLT